MIGKDGARLKPAEPDADFSSSSDPAAATTGIMVGGNGGQVRPLPIGGDVRGMVMNTPQTRAAKMSMGPNGNMHLEAGKVTMADFADILSRFVGRPVIDMTGLKGNYQIALDLAMADLMKVAQASGAMPPGMVSPGGRGAAPADTPSDPSDAAIFSSVQKLGLKLDSRKAPIETIVIDHLEKTPTEN